MTYLLREMWMLLMTSSSAAVVCRYGGGGDDGVVYTCLLYFDSCCDCGRVCFHDMASVKGCTKALWEAFDRLYSMRSHLGVGDSCLDEAAAAGNWAVAAADSLRIAVVGAGVGCNHPSDSVVSSSFREGIHYLLAPAQGDKWRCQVGLPGDRVVAVENDALGHRTRCMEAAHLTVDMEDCGRSSCRCKMTGPAADPEDGTGFQSTLRRPYSVNCVVASL